MGHRGDVAVDFHVEDTTDASLVVAVELVGFRRFDIRHEFRSSGGVPVDDSHPVTGRDVGVVVLCDDLHRVVRGLLAEQPEFVVAGTPASPSSACGADTPEGASGAQCREYCASVRCVSDHHEQSLRCDGSSPSSARDSGCGRVMCAWCSSAMETTMTVSFVGKADPAL